MTFGRFAWVEEEKPVCQRIVNLRSASAAALRLKVRVYIDAGAFLDWRRRLDERVAHAIDEEGGPWSDAMAASIFRAIVLTHAGDAA